MDSAEAELLAALQRDPDDDEARLVYADWLEERADPRGEYLRLEVEARRIPDRLSELLRRLPAEWLAAVGRKYCVVLCGDTAQKIQSIKVVREITGLGLKEAKDIVDDACSKKRRVIARDLYRADADELARKFDPSLARVEHEPFDEYRFSPTITPPTPRPPAPPPPPRYRVVLTRVEQGRSLDVIKRVRELTQRGLKDSKDIVDAVIGGTPTVLHAATDPRNAAEMVVAFAGIGEAKLEAI